MLSRRVSPHDSVVITVGKISGGVAGNVIADQATLSMIVRTTCREARQRANTVLRSIIDHTCAMHGVSAEVETNPGYDSMHNSAECVEVIRSVAERVLGAEAFSYVEHPFLGCEDFCYYCTEVPGAFYQLGSRNEALGFTAPTHSSEYDADPETVPTGMKMQAGIVFELIGK
jgi:metal-dependent amidase/aminoacylase/carboxypeptidase family protein